MLRICVENDLTTMLLVMPLGDVDKIVNDLLTCKNQLLWNWAPCHIDSLLVHTWARWPLASSSILGAAANLVVKRATYHAFAVWSVRFPATVLLFSAQRAVVEFTRDQRKTLAQFLEWLRLGE